MNYEFRKPDVRWGVVSVPLSALFNEANAVLYPLGDVVDALQSPPTQPAKALVERMLREPSRVSGDLQAKNPVACVRLIEALWELNEQRTERRDITAVERRAGLAKARFDNLRAAWLGGVFALGPDAESLRGPLSEARRIWARLLLDPSGPLPGVLDVEAELRQLAFHDGARFGVRADSSTDRTEARFQTWLAGSHFLPRFMLADVARQTGDARKALACATLVPLAQLLAASVLLVPCWSAATRLAAAAGIAGLAYAGVLAVALVRPEFLAVLCLRLPASTALGLSGLLTLDPAWLKASHGWGYVLLPLVLGAGTFGYLVLELRGAGVTGLGRLLSRSGAVLALGVGHALGATLIVYVTVGQYLVNAGLGVGTQGLQNLTMASVTALAFGVFLQVLWEDKPVTHPITGIASMEGGHARAAT